jgi:hypothetical protein
MKDVELDIRSATLGVFVASVPEKYYLDLGGATALKGLSLKVLIPTAATGAPTFFAHIHASSASLAATTDTQIASRTGMTLGAEYEIPFSTAKRAICILFDQDSTTTTAFSVITAYVGLPNNQDWRRTTEFY